MTPVDIEPEFTIDKINDLITPLKKKKEAPYIHFNTIHKRANGSTYPVEIYLQMLTIQQRTVFLAVGLDITERKRAEETLLQEQTKVQTYLDTAEVMLMALNADQTISMINRKGCRILEYKEEELIGKNWFDLCIPEKIMLRSRSYSVKWWMGNLRLLKIMKI